MKVIFLDVDGVLNSYNDMLIHKDKYDINGSFLYAEVEDRPTKILNDIIKQTEAKIVLTSSCRGGNNLLYDNLLKKFNELGLEIYSITPRVDDNHIRGLEIGKWLELHTEVDNYVILDDDSDMLLLSDHLVKTTLQNGLENSHAIEIINRLNEKSKVKTVY